jgi:Icc-related predicted phosphoesterase
MKILLSSDLHGDLKAYHRFMELLHNHELGILAGDLLDEFLPISDAKRYGLIESDFIEELYDENYDQVSQLEASINDALKNEKSINRIGLERKKKEIISLLSSANKPILFVIGNHDIASWKTEDKFIDIQNKPVKYGGFTFLGVRFKYNGIRGKIINMRKIKRIMNETTILVSHIPPYGILDFSERNDNIGSQELLSMISKKKPMYCIFGHVHEMFGFQDKMINASYFLANKYISLDLDEGKIKYLK